MRIAGGALILLLAGAVIVNAQQVVRVAGRVIDSETGEEIEGVEVIAFMQNRPNTTFADTSNAHGRFTINGLSPGWAVFDLTREGYQPLRRPRRLSSTAPRIEFTFRMERIVREPGAITPEIRDRYEEGIDLLNAGNLDEAMTIFQGLLNEYPDLYQVHTNVGFIHFQRNEFDQALEHLLIVLEHEPENADVLMYVAEVHLSQQDYEEAIGWYVRCADANPEFYYAVEKVADLARLLEDYALAKEYYRRAIELDNTKPLPILFLATILYMESNYEEAATYLEMFIEVDPEDITGGLESAQEMLREVRQRLEQQ